MPVYKILLIVNQHDSEALPKTIHELIKIPVDDLVSISWEIGDDLKRFEHEMVRPRDKKEKPK